MTSTTSAPEKMYLFGEHTAVHDTKAIAYTTNPCTTATVAEANRTD